MRILVIEDEKKVAESVARGLRDRTECAAGAARIYAGAGNAGDYGCVDAGGRKLYIAGHGAIYAEHGDHAAIGHGDER